MSVGSSIDIYGHFHRNNKIEFIQSRTKATCLYLFSHGLSNFPDCLKVMLFAP